MEMQEGVWGRRGCDDLGENLEPKGHWVCFHLLGACPGPRVTGLMLTRGQAHRSHVEVSPACDSVDRHTCQQHGLRKLGQGSAFWG